MRNEKFRKRTEISETGSGRIRIYVSGNFTAAGVEPEKKKAV